MILSSQSAPHLLCSQLHQPRTLCKRPSRSRMLCALTATDPHQGETRQEEVSLSPLSGVKIKHKIHFILCYKEHMVRDALRLCGTKAKHSHFESTGHHIFKTTCDAIQISENKVKHRVRMEKKYSRNN